MKAAVLALKAGAEREVLKADVPRRSAEAIVVVDCRREEMGVGREDYRKAKSSGKKWWWIPEPQKSRQREPQRIAAEGRDFGSTVLVDLKGNHLREA